MPPFRDGVFSAAAAVNPDIEIVSRIAAGNPGRLPALAAELVAMGVRAILAVSPAAVRAARNATATIPIVAHDLESDPIANGWAASIARPGGNITGLIFLTEELNVKRLEFLRQALPRSTKFAALVNPSNTSHPPIFKATLTPARRATSRRRNSSSTRVPSASNSALTATIPFLSLPSSSMASIRFSYRFTFLSSYYLSRIGNRLTVL